MQHSKVIVSLDDRMTSTQACEFVRRTSHLVWGYKVNNLLMEYGAGFIGVLKQVTAGKVFADLKLLDMPNTVKSSVCRLSNHGADLITVHGIGGTAMIQAAAEAAPKKVLVISALTSYEEDFLRLSGGQRLSYIRSVGELSHAVGVAGMVLSHIDLGAVSHISKDFLRVVPAISPNDPGSIIKTTQSPRNADLVVVGKLVTGSDNPIAALNILNQIME